jgi:hypothetical protein
VTEDGDITKQAAAESVLEARGSNLDQVTDYRDLFFFSHESQSGQSRPLPYLFKFGVLRFDA